jgi:hypothetical protein
MRVRQAAGFLAAFFIVAGGAALLTWRSRGVPNLFLEDDAYFYLQIAWNIGTGHGSTFDGLHTTNGYHLLWMGILATLARVVSAIGLGKTAFVAATSALSLSIALAATLWAFTRTAERVLVMLLFLFCGVTMESTILGALLLVGMRQFVGEIRLGTTTVAVVAALVPLARIDYAWLLPALALLGAARGAEQAALAPGPTLVGAAIGVALHLGVEQLVFGAWASVSSSIKAIMLVRYGLAGLLSRNLRGIGNEIRYAIVVAFAVFTCYRASARVRAAVVMAVAPLAFYTVFSFVRDWYFAVPLLTGALLASRAPRPARAWPALATALSVLIAASFGAYLFRNQADWMATAAFVERANGMLAPGDIVYQVDGSGFPAWHLGSRVVNGDGLVNSWSYRDRLVAENLGTYLDDIGATHIIVTGPQGSRLLRYHGLEVRPDQARLLLEAERASTQNVHYRLYALSPRLRTISPESAGVVPVTETSTH